MPIVTVRDDKGEDGALVEW